MNNKSSALNIIIDFIIYLGIIVHLSMFLPSPLGAGGQDIGIHLALILLLASRRLNLREIFLNKLSLLFLFFFLFLSLSTLFYSEMPVALNSIRSRLKGVSLFFTIQILCFSDLKRDNIFGLALFPLFLIYLNIASFLPYFSGIRYGADWPGLRALGLWHNRTARLWNMVLPVTVATLFLVKRKLLKWVLAFFTAASLVGIPMTLSRAGTLSLAVLAAGFITGLFFLKKELFSRRVRFLVILGLLAAAAAGLYLNREPIQARFATADWVSLTGRSDIIWPAVLEAVKERPFTGYGFAAFPEISRDLLGRNFHHAHNIFLQVLFEGGIAALAVFLVLCVSFIKKSLKVMLKEKSGLYGLSFLSVFLAVILVHGMAEHIRFLPFSFFMASAWFYRAYEKLSEN